MSRLSRLVHRWHGAEGAAECSAPLTATRWGLFDHVPKTGGTAINQALARLFPLQVSTDSHKLVAAGDLGFAGSYPIICGHFGGRWRRKFRAEKDRVTFTVIRDPVARVISTYSYWRHRVEPGHTGYHRPGVEAARTLDFASFIRADVPDARNDLFNRHFAHLNGADKRADLELADPADHADRIAALADEFDVLGTTERLADSLQWFLRELGCERPRTEALLQSVSANRSPRLADTEITRVDRNYILERSRLDLALLQIARKRMRRFAWSCYAKDARNAWAILSRPSSAG